MLETLAGLSFPGILRSWHLHTY